MQEISAAMKMSGVKLHGDNGAPGKGATMLAPLQRYRGDGVAILERRKRTYPKAREKNRFAGQGTFATGAGRRKLY
jgi:hypothetical protein